MSLQITFTKSMLEGLSKSTLIEIICSLQEKDDSQEKIPFHYRTKQARRVIYPRRAWKAEDDQALLADLANGLTAEAHAKRCQRSTHAVEMRLWRLQETGITKIGVTA
jgi:hypothetical protein